MKREDEPPHRELNRQDAKSPEKLSSELTGVVTWQVKAIVNGQQPEVVGKGS